MKNAISPIMIARPATPPSVAPTAAPVEMPEEFEDGGRGAMGDGVGDWVLTISQKSIL